MQEFQEVNEDPANPNSAVLVTFQTSKLRVVEDEAVMSVLFHLLKEPFFH